MVHRYTHKHTHTCTRGHTDTPRANTCIDTNARGADRHYDTHAPVHVFLLRCHFNPNSCHSLVYCQCHVTNYITRDCVLWTCQTVSTGHFVKRQKKPNNRKIEEIRATPTARSIPRTDVRCGWRESDKWLINSPQKPAKLNEYVEACSVHDEISSQTRQALVRNMHTYDNPGESCVSFQSPRSVRTCPRNRQRPRLHCRTDVKTSGEALEKSNRKSKEKRAEPPTLERNVLLRLQLQRGCDFCQAMHRPS